jgi:hypothetical protein
MKGQVVNPGVRDLIDTGVRKAIMVGADRLSQPLARHRRV